MVDALKAVNADLIARWKSLRLSNQKIQFLLKYLANGRNATKAFLAAGYSHNGAAANASRLIASDKMQRALATTTREDVANLDAVVTSLAEVAFDADLADFDAFFAGQSMGQLREAGVNTKLVKSAKVRRVTHEGKDKEGEDESYLVTETRELVLHDRLAALGQLRTLVSEKLVLEDDEAAQSLVDAVLERFYASRTRPQLPGARAPKFAGIDVEVIDGQDQAD